MLREINYDIHKPAYKLRSYAEIITTESNDAHIALIKLISYCKLCAFLGNLKNRKSAQNKVKDLKEKRNECSTLIIFPQPIEG